MNQNFNKRERDEHMNHPIPPAHYNINDVVFNSDNNNSSSSTSKHTYGSPYVKNDGKENEQDPDCNYTRDIQKELDMNYAELQSRF